MGSGDSLEKEASRAVPPWVRVAVMLAAPLLVALLGRVDAPGLDLEGFEGSGADFGVFALGLTPALSAYVVVEVLALLVPRWRRVRFAGLAGRAPIERAARIVTVLFAVSQAAGVVLSLLALPGGPPARGPLGLFAMGATWVAGACLLYYVANLVSRYGCANGFVWLTITATAPKIVRVVASFAAPGTSGGAAMLETCVAAAAVLLVLVATLAVLPWRAPRATQASAPSTAYRGEAPPPEPATPFVWLPVLVASVVPYRIASNAVAYVAGASSSSVLRASPRLDLVVGFGLAALLAVAFTYALQPTGRATDAMARAARTDARALTAPLTSARTRGLVLSLIYLAVLFLARNAVMSLPSGGTIEMDAVALVAAGLVDVLATLRAYLRRPDRVVAWEDLRPHVIPPLLDALSEAGIDAEVRGLAPLTLLRFFGPFAPAEILVPRADLERAVTLVRSRLGGEEAPTPAPPPARIEEGTRATPIASTVGRAISLGAALVFGVGLFTLATFVRHHEDPPPGAPVSLLVLRVADELDPLGEASEDSLPPGVALSTELAPLGQEPVERRFARVVPQPGETLGAAEARARAWLATFALPAGDLFAFADVLEDDPGGGAPAVVAVRTYVVARDPVLTEADVVEADAALERDQGYVYVAVTLSDEGARRFAEATGANVGHRMAILVNGKVMSAPVVRDAITGGHVSITMGGGPIEDQMRDAKRLAASLRASKR